jgi:Putative metal-binding motif
MKTFFDRRTYAGIGLYVAVTAFSVAPAHAEVIEPNGNTVPDLLQLKNPNYSEVTLQKYFDTASERIDAVTDARKEPGKFSPLCNFEASLVLSAGGIAGLAWYNVNEADPHAPPFDLHHLLAPSQVPTATFSAKDIAADPAFVGPYIGFALTKDLDNNPNTDPTAVYYSEYQRNPLCSGCSTKDYWVAALAYRASTRSDTYYVAFEDWEMYGGTSPTDWNNDGDFNDKVFKLVGISCAGGGLPCETGGIGLCGIGVSECALDGGTPACTPLYKAREEVCDAVDNDCNGETDEGSLCPVNQICVKGSCVFGCGGEEFQCPDGYACGSDNYCIESACVNVACKDGLACRKGVCKSPCSDVTCPLNQTCVDGVCKDICATKVCGTGSVCDSKTGACVGTCGCTACTDGKICDTESGKCVDSGCVGKSCDIGFGCVNGTCVDACANAVCPGGAKCTNGTCATPVITSNGGGGSGTGGSIDIGPAAGSTSANAGTAGEFNSSVTGSTSNSLGSSDSGCGCRLALVRQRNFGELIAFGLLFFASRRKRRTS